MKTRLVVKPVLVAALAAAVAVAGCSRALPTSSDSSTPAASTGSRASLGQTSTTQQAWLLTPVVNLLVRIVSNPVFILDPAVKLLDGVLQYVPVVNQLVPASGNTTVQGGRWTLQFHDGSLAAPTPVSVSTASDGTMRVQFGPDGTQFGTPVDLTIDYSGTSLDPSSPNYQRNVVPQFLYFDPKLKSWVELPSVNDPLHKCVHAKLQHFSQYGLGGRAGW